MKTTTRKPNREDLKKIINAVNFLLHEIGQLQNAMTVREMFDIDNRCEQQFGNDITFAAAQLMERMQLEGQSLENIDRLEVIGDTDNQVAAIYKEDVSKTVSFRTKQPKYKFN